MSRRDRRRRSALRAEPRVEAAPAPELVAAPASRTTYLVGAAVVLAALVLYLATAARDIVFGDSPELTAAAATLGVAHPPGYPVWTVVAHLFTLVPIDTLSFRVSAFSAVCAASAVGVVYWIGYRLSGSVVGAATSAALLALTPVFWSWAIVPEVFALAALLAALLIALLVAWWLDLRDRSLIAAAFVGGLGLAHHQTIVLLAPAALLLMWLRRDAVLRNGLLWKSALAFAAGLLPYAYLPIAASRDPAWSYGDIHSAGDLAAHILRTDLGSGQLVGGTFQGGSLIERLVFYAQAFDLASAALIVVGAVVLYRQARPLFWAFAAAAVLSGPAFAAYASVNLAAEPVLHTLLERFFIVSHVVAAPLAALGVAELARRWPSAVAAPAIGIGATAVVAVVAALNAGHIDQRENHDARRYAEDILATVPQGKVLLVSGDASLWTVEYLHTIEGQRPDVTVLDTPLLTFAWYVRQASRAHPDLTFRVARFDGRAGTSRDLVEPNGADRFEIQGGLLDDSLVQSYLFVRRGLVEELRPRSAPPDVDAFAADNDKWLRSYHLPAPADVAGRNWDTLVLGDYALIAFDVGRAYESRKDTAHARDWYTRALAIAPDFTDARTALARLPKP